MIENRVGVVGSSDDDDDKAKVITILSIDGGGIRGVIPAYILPQLETLIREEEGREDARIAEYFDIIAGTSTGSILTALLTAPEENNKERPGHDASEFVEFYEKFGSKIFTSPFSMDSIKSRIKTLIQVYGDIFKIQLDNWTPSPSSKINLLHNYLKYFSMIPDTENLHDEVDKQLKLVKLSQTVTKVVIPAFRFSKSMPVIFTNHLKEENVSGDIALRDAILSSSAAPFYFPPHLFKFSVKEGKTKDEMFYDGGLGANNPTLAALCEATYTYGNEKDYSNYLVLSLGTGQTKLPGTAQCSTFTSWLFSQIKSTLGINFIMQTVSDTVDFQMSRFFHRHPQNYLRIQKYDLDEKEADMCNGKLEHVQNLEKIAANLLSKEKVKIVDPYTGIMKDTKDNYGDALKIFARKLVQQKRMRDEAKEELVCLSS